MIFANLTAGDAVFLDANTFIFYFGPDPGFGPPCAQLMRQIENQVLFGFTSTYVLAEAAHRLMISEAVTVGGWVPGKVTRRLKSQPSVLQQLSRFRIAVETILHSKINVLGDTSALLANALVISQQHGLLMNDARIVSVMQAQGLTNLASADSDFDRVPGIVRYGPA